MTPHRNLEGPHTKHLHRLYQSAELQDVMDIATILLNRLDQLEADVDDVYRLLKEHEKL